MISFSLQSGSNGNSIYVETSDARLLFDAGISGRQAQLRMAHYKRDIRKVQALIISHDHNDHARCAGVYHRKFHLPVYVTKQTLKAAGNLGEISDLRHFASGETLEFGRTKVYTIRTPHDGVDGVAFVVEKGRKRLGIFTDLGHVFEELPEWLNSVDAAFLESNYDPQLLQTGDYPIWLKRRIAGKAGHLSNPEAAKLARSCCKKLKSLALAHLSEHNNTPELAVKLAQTQAEGKYQVEVLPRYGVGPVLVV
jgi:phosphoribosyl 1,2-cyclic phosphodiesterase